MKCACQRNPSIIHHPNDKLLKATFSNPDNAEVRADGTLKLSEDDGRTWTKSFRYARKPAPNFTGYSDIAVLRDSSVAVLYERGDLNDSDEKSERYDEIGLRVVPFEAIDVPIRK